MAPSQALAIDPKLEGQTEYPKIDSFAAPGFGEFEEQTKPAKPDEELLLDDHGREIPPWYHQITFRALFVGACISVLFCIMTLK